MHSLCRVKSVSCRDGDHSPSTPVPGCLDRLHFQPSSNHLEECSWRWTSPAAPTLFLGDRRCSLAYRVYAELVCPVSRPVDDGNLRASLLARFVLAESPCPRYTKREMDRVRHPRTPTGPNCVINRLVQMSDKAPSAEINHNLRLCAANRTWDVLRRSYGFWFWFWFCYYFLGATSALRQP